MALRDPTNLFIVGQEWFFLLVYRDGSLFFSLHALRNPQSTVALQFIVILSARTLSIELCFYLVAPFIVRRHLLLIAAIAYASALSALLAYHYGYYSVPTDYGVFAFELSLFLYGSIIFHLRDYLTPSDPRISTVIAFAIAALVAIISSRYRYYVANQYELYAIVGVLLPTPFDLSRRHK